MMFLSTYDIQHNHIMCDNRMVVIPRIEIITLKFLLDKISIRMNMVR